MKTSTPPTHTGFNVPERPLLNVSHMLACNDMPTAECNHCIRVEPVVQSLTDIQNDVSEFLLHVIADIEYLVPVGRPPSQRSRHSRSWLPFIGRL